MMRLFRGSQKLPEDQTVEILDRHLDADFRVSPMADTPTSLAQIKSIGKTFGVEYPLELAAHICGQFPGVFVEVKESVWPRPQAYDVGPFWSFLYAIHTYTSASESMDWMRLDFAAASFQKRTGLPAAPILRRVGDANLFCVDAKGKLLQFDHEENTLDPVDLNFWGLFEREVADLKTRKIRKAKGG
jgi:hypothetical protein